MRLWAALAPFDTKRKLTSSLFPLLLLALGIVLVARVSDWRAALPFLLLFLAIGELLRRIWRQRFAEVSRRSEEMLRITQRLAQIGSRDWDLASGRLECSDEICHIFGIEPGERPTTHEAYLALLHQEGRHALAAAVSDALAGAGSSYAVEHAVVQPDGSERIVYDVGEVFRGASGVPVRVVSVVHDITDRKQAEGAVFFEKRYRWLIENLPQRIFLKDRNSVYLSCNSSFARDLGLKPEDIFGKSDHDLFPAPMARKRLGDDQRVIAGGVPEERDEQRDRDGSWVSKALIPLKDDTGSVYGLLGILTDINSRKRAEEQLKESEQRFRDTFEQAAVGICHFSLDGTVTRINRRFCDILGYSQSELLGRTLDETIHPDDLLPERNQALRLLRREIENYSLELRHLRKDGSLVWVNLTKSLLCGEDGEPRYLAAVIEDITAKREAEALRRERDMVQAASRAKSQFLAGMSHEIRTPMNAIIGLGRLVLQSELNAKQREYLEKICSSGQTLLDIINDILDFSKIEAGRVELERTEFALTDVLGAISDMFSVKAQEKGIKYRVRLDQQLPQRLLGDPLRLTQVLNNLVGNAVKFTEQGEVVVDVKPVEWLGEQVSVHFSVQDTGVGLSPEQIGRIFTPFTQADSSTTRRFGGTGLGLSISSQLVELMGGELRVQSVPGAGSSFYFTVNFGMLGADGECEVEREPEHSSLRLLVLDQDPASRERLSELLQGLPLAVDFVDSVPAALAALAEARPPAGNSFDLAVVDGLTAGESGLEAICRDVAGRPQRGFSLMAVVPQERLAETRLKSDELGLSVVLGTPLRPSLMLDGIVRALCRSQLLEEREPRPPSRRQRDLTRQGLREDVVMEPARLAAEAAKLERLLSRNSLDAKRQFAVFRSGLPQGAFSTELKALELCLDRLDFKKARQLLAGFAGSPSQLTPEERERA